MKWHVGSDHAGFALKSHLADVLRQAGDEVVDHGTTSSDRVDYPDFAARVARAVATAEAVEWGLLVCGSGVGVSMTANRFPGVRAVVAGFEAQAALGRAHNNANVLCLGERLTAPGLAERILEVFKTTPFEGGRHAGRVTKIDTVAAGEEPAGGHSR